MNKKASAAVLFFAVVLVVTSFINNDDQAGSADADLVQLMEQADLAEATPAPESSEAAEDPVVFTRTATLKDVTGDSIRNTDFSAAVGGTVQDGYNAETQTYLMEAIFTGLPEPADDEFYEGWLVDKATGLVLSTGEAEDEGGEYSNLFSSSTDYTYAVSYVLTLEPRDGDPRPDAHVLEGAFTAN